MAQVQNQPAPVDPAGQPQKRQEEHHQPERQWTRLQKNNRVFAVIYTIMQIFIIVMFAIFVRPQAYASTLDNGLWPATCVAILVLIGFGLYFTYLKHLNWSGLGFTLLITVIVFQFYFLVNSFWTQANVQDANVNFSNTHVSAFLSDENSTTTVPSYGLTAVEAFKCALSMSIAFAAIGGRAGPLEAIIICIFGTILYELNRQILTIFSNDFGGSMTIFQFGGIMGTVIALILYKRKQQQIVRDHVDYTSSKLNITLALLGSAFCWVFFPILNVDMPINMFPYSNAGISTIICISTCVVMTVAFSLIKDGCVHYRDIITAPIAGGVIIGSSSYLCYNPLQPVVIGIIGALMQLIFNGIEKRIGHNTIWSNGVTFLFGVQGLIGGIASAIISAMWRTTSPWDTSYAALTDYYKVHGQAGQISGTFVTLGIAAATGLVLGLVISVINQNQVRDMFHDRAFWIMDDDGISNLMVQKAATEDPEADYEEGIEVKGAHAYL